MCQIVHVIAKQRRKLCGCLDGSAMDHWKEGAVELNTPHSSGKHPFLAIWRAIRRRVSIPRS